MSDNKINKEINKEFDEKLIEEFKQLFLLHKEDLNEADKKLILFQAEKFFEKISFFPYKTDDTRILNFYCTVSKRKRNFDNALFINISGKKTKNSDIIIAGLKDLQEKGFFEDVGYSGFFFDNFILNTDQSSKKNKEDFDLIPDELKLFKSFKSLFVFWNKVESESNSKILIECGNKKCIVSNMYKNIFDFYNLIQECIYKLSKDYVNNDIDYVNIKLIDETTHYRLPLMEKMMNYLVTNDFFDLKKSKKLYKKLYKKIDFFLFLLKTLIIIKFKFYYNYVRK